MAGKLYEKDYLLMSNAPIRSAIADFDVDGGGMVVLGDLDAKEKSCFVATKPLADSKSVAIVYNPVLHYVMEGGVKLPTRTKSPDETCFAGDTLDVFVPFKGLIFGVNADNIDGTPTKGQFLEVKADSTLYAVSATQTPDVASFEVIDIVAHRNPTGGVIGGTVAYEYVVKTVFND